jgi:DNA polymerase elongation subunit (family B)
MRTHNFELVGGDTDGLAFRKKDHSIFTMEEIDFLLKDLNSNMGEFIKWENDGLFPAQLVKAPKNYVLVDSNGKRKIKGASFKATTKERALRKFVNEVIELLLADKSNEISDLYFKYVSQILKIDDISDWCSKYTITKAVLTGKETVQVRIREALKGHPVQEGDKVYQFFKTPETRCMLQDFDGTYDVSILLGKLYKTLCIFQTVIDVKAIPNLTLKRNQVLLKEMNHANLSI